MNIVDHLNDKKNVTKNLSDSADNLKKLAQILLGIKKGNTQSYSIFNRNMRILLDIKNLSILFSRMYENRIRLYKQDYVLNELYIENNENSLNDVEYFFLFEQCQEINNHINLDHYSSILLSFAILDSIFIYSSYIFGVKNPSKTTFSNFIQGKCDGDIEIIWNLRNLILWLDGAPRIYRNKILVHYEKPWQYGNGRGTGTFDWHVSSPIIPNWHDKSQMDAVKNKAINLLKTHDLEYRDHLTGDISTLLDNIFLFNDSEIIEIRQMAENFGFSMPSFHKFSNKISNFLNLLILILIERVNSNPDEVNFGLPS